MNSLYPLSRQTTSKRCLWLLANFLFAIFIKSRVYLKNFSGLWRNLKTSNFSTFSKDIQIYHTDRYQYIYHCILSLQSCHFLSLEELLFLLIFSFQNIFLPNKILILGDGCHWLAFSGITWQKKMTILLVLKINQKLLPPVKFKV